MKKVSMAILFIFILTAVSAQSNVSVIQLTKAPKAKLIDQSNFGKVYALPQDNMPCIVTPHATAALMPVFNTPLVKATIPNAIQEQELIAANTIPNDLFKLYKAPQQPSKNLMLDLIRKK
jgi:hypothetical protein